MSRIPVGPLGRSIAAWLRSLALAAAMVLLPGAVAVAAPGDLDASFQADGIAEMDWSGADDVATAVLVEPNGSSSWLA
jgi:hypothetical protein